MITKRFVKDIDYLGFGLLLFSMSFCFGIAINSIAFVILNLTLIFSIFKGQTLNFKEISFFAKLVLGFSIYTILIEVFTNSSILLSFVTSKAIAFLTFPVLISLNKLKVNTYKDLVIKGFVFSCFISALINWLYAIYRGLYLTNGTLNYWYFSYDLFAEPFGIQPIYLGLYYVSAIIFLHFTKISRFTYSLILFILFVSTLMLAARNAILSMFLMLPLLILFTKKIKLKNIVPLIFVVLISIFFVFKNPIIKNRIFKVAEKGNFYSGQSLRINIWKSACSLVDENYFGLGNVETANSLKVEFKKRKLLIPVKYNYNSHSQYLQVIIQYGLIGFVLFAMVLFFLIYILFIDRNLLGLFWIILILISFITEAILVRQWGSFFFVFFSIIFSFRENLDQERL